MADGVSYPVFVEYTQTHIVWVEADSPERAAEHLASWPYDNTKDDETLFRSGLSVHAPKDHWDWEDAYEDGEAYSADHDAHVEHHRFTLRIQKEAAERAACTEAGHPDTDPPIWDGRIWCNRCKRYLEPARAVS